MSSESHRPDGIPRWTTALNAVVVCILTFKTYSAAFDPRLAYASDAGSVASPGVLWELGGRNLAMIAAVVAATWFRSPRALQVVFTMHFVRESIDMAIALDSSGPSALAFLLFLVPYGFAIRRLGRMSDSPRGHARA